MKKKKFYSDLSLYIRSQMTGEEETTFEKVVSGDRKLMLKAKVSLRNFLKTGVLKYAHTIVQTTNTPIKEHAPKQLAQVQRILMLAPAKRIKKTVIFSWRKQLWLIAGVVALLFILYYFFFT